jgi:branched-chain amino acid transport system substrate-binding protein
MKRIAVVGMLTGALIAAACSRAPEPIRVGAVYPLSGSQGPGGVDEYRGARLAIDLVNADGGVSGRALELEPIDVSGPDEAPGAIASLARRGVRFVLGSYGSTVSAPASAEAARRGMLFWETGAVGSMPGPGGGRFFFRIAPSGWMLGRAAVSFIAERLAPMLHRSPGSLRFAVANVDDLYGQTVAEGAVQQIRSLGLPFAGQFPYPARRPDLSEVVTRIARARTDVLFVSAYLEDGIALRRELVRQHVPLIAGIGTSSSFCHLAFGQALGRDAVGLFASDKPDSEAIDVSGLLPVARRLLDRARAAYRAAYLEEMTAPALAGFSAAWALFHEVMPQAEEMTPQAVGETALRTRIAPGGLPNGSGLELAPSGSADAGANLRASSVIWEWIGVNRRAVVWPPQFATAPITPLPLTR